MSCIVQKFGGTSVSTLDRIKHVADIIAQTRRNGAHVISVVSAMAGVTNKFIEYARDMMAFEGDPEYDSVVSSGELVTSGLLAIALNNLGIKARSYAAWQVPIYTDDSHGQAVIQSISSTNLQKDLMNGMVPVIAGFQGISKQNKITTLGRGGSDLTAVAVAAAMKSQICEIYSDVDGIYTVDPNIYQEARKLDQINLKEMLLLALYGAKVLQCQSVQYALDKKVQIRAASSFVNNGGTLISPQVPAQKYCGIATARALAKLQVTSDHPQAFELLSKLLKQHFIRVEYVQKNGQFWIDKDKVIATIGLLGKCDFIKNIQQTVSRKLFSRVSLIGTACTVASLPVVTKILQGNGIEIVDAKAEANSLHFIVCSEKLCAAIATLHKHCGFES